MKIIMLYTIYLCGLIFIIDSIISYIRKKINKRINKKTMEEVESIEKSMKKSKPRRHLVMLTVDELIKIMEKNPGKTMLECQDEIIKKGDIIGSVPGDVDGDMLTGELRDHGLKVKNLNEEYRKKKMKEKDDKENA